MKLIDVLSLVLSFGVMIIGIDQSMSYGIANSYWLYMISLGFLFFYSYRKAKREGAEKEQPKQKPKKSKR